ncbi:conserved hypothetical protein [Yersinia pestis Nepal516]|uniref:Uncharacterized protein n=2 Tax=Yersinia pestis TaxID=632 RepID=Q8CKK6_YERPE|nr:hypothetical [Yersinia pestis KIM10+]ABG19507.1 conserved hypothetical protein [Yersinia pestis Nepal516]
MLTITVVSAVPGNFNIKITTVNYWCFPNWEK